MSLEHSPAKQSRVAYTVNEFCDAHRVSRGKLYQLWAEGTGPKFINVGVKRIISFEAAAAWRAKMESESAAKSAPEAA
jgi:hypothetical protein